MPIDSKKSTGIATIDNTKDTKYPCPAGGEEHHYYHNVTRGDGTRLVYWGGTRCLGTGMAQVVEERDIQGKKIEKKPDASEIFRRQGEYVAFTHLDGVENPGRFLEALDAMGKNLESNLREAGGFAEFKGAISMPALPIRTGKGWRLVKTAPTTRPRSNENPSLDYRDPVHTPDGYLFGAEILENEYGEDGRALVLVHEQEPKPSDHGRSLYKFNARTVLTNGDRVVAGPRFLGNGGPATIRFDEMYTKLMLESLKVKGVISKKS